MVSRASERSDSTVVMTPSRIARAEDAQVSVLHEVLDTLRAAHVRGQVALGESLDAIIDRLERDLAWANAVRDAVHALLKASTSTHSLTETGLLGNRGLVDGLVHGLAARIAPAPARTPALEDALVPVLRRGDADLFEAIDVARAATIVRHLSDAATGERPEVSSALVILATRIAGDGLDPRLTERIPTLESWQSPFVALSRVVDRYAEAWVDRAATLEDCDEALEAIRRCRQEVAAFRQRKQVLGTTLHLSSASLRMQQQLRRLDLLVRCTRPLDQGADIAIARVSIELLAAVTRRWPGIDFLRDKLGLLSYLVVGHAAQKGEGYEAHTRADLGKFIGKSTLGGLIVAVFATLKPVLGRAELPPVWQAGLYGLNYAACFVLIYWLGATLATKQPAVTASRLAAALEEGPEHEDFARLVRSIWLSQYVSFVGNILGAAGMALVLVVAIEATTGLPVLTSSEALYLARSLDLTGSGTVFYAGVAGVMLAFAGLVSGFVDNAVVFHRLGDRVRAGTGVLRLIPARWRGGCAETVNRSLGVVTGNAVLGFLLGSAGTIGLLLGAPFDIRHIAFASAHSALAVWFSPELQTPRAVALLLGAVLTIGLVNFLVSFGLTLQLAITSRRVEGIDWRRQLRQLWRLVRAEPGSFVVPAPGAADAGAGEEGAGT